MTALVTGSVGFANSKSGFPAGVRLLCNGGVCYGFGRDRQQQLRPPWRGYSSLVAAIFAILPVGLTDNGSSLPAEGATPRQ